MYCQSAFHPRSHKNQHDANVLCFGTSVAKIATNSKGNKETSLNEISKKTGIHFNVCFYSVSLLENDMLVVLKGPWQKPLRYGIHDHFCYKMSFFHVPFHVPCEVSRIVDLHFKVRPCRQQQKHKSFRKSPYNPSNPNICSIFFQHQVPH